jgi:hypothetical protein
MREMAGRYDGAARRCGTMAGGVAARVVRLRPAIGSGTPLGGSGESALLAEIGRKAGWPCDVLGSHSRAEAKIRRRARLIREKIIGHDLRGFASGIRRRAAITVACRSHAGLALLAGRGAFTLLHQPTRQHGRGVLFEPRIEQLRDLLAEIGGVAQPRKFVTLQGIAGRRQKKLPRRLGFVIQGNLQGKLDYITSTVNVVKSAQLRTYCGKLCKSLPCGRGLQSVGRYRAASL